MRIYEFIQEAKVSDVIKPQLMWSAPITIRFPHYVGRTEVTVSAPNIYIARQLIKAQYNVADYHIGSIKRIKPSNSL